MPGGEVRLIDNRLASSHLVPIREMAISRRLARFIVSDRSAGPRFDRDTLSRLDIDGEFFAIFARITRHRRAERGRAG